MKTLLSRWIYCLVFLSVGAANLAARTPLIQEEPEITLVPADQAPAIGTFYSLQNIDNPPLPFCPFTDVDIFAIKGGGFLFDDSQIDYVALREAAALETAVSAIMLSEESQMMSLYSAPPSPGGGGSNSPPQFVYYPPTTNGLRLLRPVLSATAVTLTVAGGTNADFYDLYSTTNLTGSHITNSTWTWKARVVDGGSYALPLENAAQAFYVLGLTNDTDHGGFSDAYEKLVTHGNINNSSDDNAPIVRIQVVDSVAIEQATTNTATFLLTRLGTNNSLPLTVACIRSGTASNGVDYTLSPIQTNPYPMDCAVTFAAGQTNAEIILTAVNDTVTEGAETVTLILAANWPTYRVDTNHASATAYILEEFTHNYTSNVDFSLGVMSGLEAVSNQLQFKTNLQTQFPYISVACSMRGTVARINTTNGQVVGEYRTMPLTSLLRSDPSRTTVDQYGNVWVANRQDNIYVGDTYMGSVTRIGLILGTRYSKSGTNYTPYASGQYVKVSTAVYNTCIDRDGDGYIRTSSGLADILPWSNELHGLKNTDTYGGVSTAEDEAITEYTRVFGSGIRTIAVDKYNDVWVGGIGQYTHQKLNGLTGDVLTGTIFEPGCGGYGGVIDGQGALWSVYGCIMLMRPPTDFPITQDNWTNMYPDGLFVYGISLDPKHPYIWNTAGASGTTFDLVIRWNTNGTVYTKTNGVVENYEHGGGDAKGLTVDTNGHVWVAQWGSTNIGHLNTNGTWITNVTLSFGGVVGRDPTGVSVDANGSIWATCESSHDAFRIDPNAGPLVVRDGQTNHAGAVDMVVDLGDGSFHTGPYTNVPARPYNYSDMTGLNNQVVNPDRLPLKGYWNVIDDSGVAGENWRRVSWNALTDGGSVEAYARASDERPGLANLAFLPITNNLTITNLRGRFIEVRLALVRPSGTNKPVVQDLTLQGISPALVGGVAPGSSTVYETQSAVFTADVTGSEPLTYQWFVLHPVADVQLTLEGATNRSLCATNVDSWDDGCLFFVRVNNSIGDSIVYGPGVLTVLPQTNRIPATGTSGAAARYPMNIDMFGQSSSLSSVQVVVSNLCHACPNNLNVLLVCPDGYSVMLMSHAGGNTPVTNATLVFDLEHDALSETDPIPSNTTIFCGPGDYGSNSLPGAPSRPYSGLGDLKYSDPNGTWHLYIYDDTQGDSGELRGSWRLNISAY